MVNGGSWTVNIVEKAPQASMNNREGGKMSSKAPSLEACRVEYSHQSFHLVNYRFGIDWTQFNAERALDVGFIQLR